MVAKNTKNTFDTLVAALVSAFTSGLPGNLKSVTVQGASSSNAAVLTKLQSIAAVEQAAVSARQAASVAVADRDKALPANRAYVKSLVASLKVLFEGNTAALTALGINPPKPRKPKSGEALVIAKARTLATRAARGTKGTQQRLAITATPVPTVTVAGVVATPSSSSESVPTPASSPAAPAAPAK
jgi:hypothetical protein